MKLLTTVAALLLTLQAPLVLAQTACNSDGAAPPPALFERFLSADCAECWADTQTPSPGSSAALLDWIVPSAAGDAAALYAAERRDALARLVALGRPLPQSTDTHVSTHNSQLPGEFRVALGPAVNDYVSSVASYAGRIPALGLHAGQGLEVWLTLVEQIPAGVEDAGVRRNLVRGLFHTRWQQSNQLRKHERGPLPRDTQWIDRVAMQLPAGTDPERLSLIGWVEGADDDLWALVQSACQPPHKAPATRQPAAHR